jgi:hypothetical protein
MSDSIRKLALFALGAYAAWSQITTGALSGTLGDPAGSVMAGAK